ncbi:hypothetical protein QJ854_gp846 [Moumouvirus goulette]|uniref:Uncharacterized protein n=1 Tax=Moumouvirus goulette TaxID=1247379 RepID=M1PM06_9VIRU|nr:hypothetical protein QJ854_gp846 [Moumouvirus goulette]AGF84936.1 hypothetical protein glt_00127 [Moumouvirus goulette]
MNMLDNNVKEINGPINVIRMEGTVSGTKKIIYLFMDFHIGLDLQTECPNIYSEEIQYFLAKSFENISKRDKIYDFFLEILPSKISKQFISDKKNIYLFQVFKFFRKIFNYDPDKNLVHVSDKLQNVRLHYVDIRDYFEFNFFIDLEKYTSQINELWINQSIDINILQ